MDRRLRFELLYGRHAASVKAYVLRRADRAIVDDVVAEVFLVCWRRLEEIPPDPLPWLLGVARRVLSTERRGARRRLALAGRLGESDAVLAEAPATIFEAGDAVLDAALRRLGADDRELLMLIAWEGLSSADAARVLQIKPATARVRLMRVRRRLARELAAQDGAALSGICSLEAS